MPDRQLTQEDDRKSIEEWLEDAFPYKNGFIPCKDEFNEYLHDNAIKDIFDRKGIYFWFLNIDGYKKLHELSEKKIPGINLKLENAYIRKFNNEEYTLVYIGLAGAQKRKNNINNTTLKDRINLHLVKGQGSSTLRDTIGSLINKSYVEDYDDIINEFLKNYFVLLVIGYGYVSEYLKIYKKIQDDEKVLIERIMPVLNFKENPNASNNDHVTGKINKIRNEFRKKYFPESKKSESKTLKKKSKTKKENYQIMKCNFKLNGNDINYTLKNSENNTNGYNLLANDKFIKEKIKPKIRQYILENRLESIIPLLNKNKTKKNTNQLCVDFLKYMNSIKI